MPDGPQSMHASESRVALMIVGGMRQIVFGILQAEVDGRRVNLVVWDSAPSKHRHAAVNRCNSVLDEELLTVGVVINRNDSRP